VFCCGLRVVSIDGSTSDVPDEAPNAEHFGRPSNQARDGVFPQVRWLAAAESGTGCLLGASLGPYRDSEQALARDLLDQGCFGPGMVVLADRKFLSWALAREFLAIGTRILWRAPASFTLKPVKVLPDGTLPGGTETAPRQGRPAAETVIGRHKTGMGEGHPVLRSKDPADVEQEMWALFAVYQAVCKITGIGAAGCGHPAGQDQLPACPGRRDGHRRGFFP
jgi:hypothetical protein